MADPAISLSVESTWLHAYLEHQSDEIFFFRAAEDSMRKHAISRLDVLQVLREADVVESEKIDEGARWHLQGNDRDGRTLWVALRVDVNAIRVEVIDVGRS